MRGAWKRHWLLLIALLGVLPPAAAQSWQGRADLEIRVASRKGGALAGARVELRYRGGRETSGPPAVATDAKGRAVVLGLASGTWQVEVQHPDYMSFVAVVRLDDRDKPEVTASFLEAAEGASTPIQVKLLKAKGGRASPPLPVIAAAPRREEQTPPPAVATSVPESEPAAPAAPTPPSQPVPAPEPEPEPAAEEKQVREEAARPAVPEATPSEVQVESAIRPAPETVAETGPETMPEPVIETPAAPAMAAEVVAPTAIPTPAPSEPEAPPAPEKTAPPPPTAAAPDSLPEAPPNPEVEPVIEPQPEPTPVEPPAPTPPLPQPVPPIVVPTPVPEPAPPEASISEPSTTQPTSPPPTSPPPASPEPPTVASVPPSPPVAPSVPAHWRAYRDRTCPECRPSEWAVTVSAPLRAAGACPGNVVEAVHKGMTTLSHQTELELSGFAGQLTGPDGALAAVPQAAAERLSAALAGAGAGGCQPLSIVLPKTARFVGFQYEYEDATGREPCLPDRPCGGDAVAFMGPPRIARGASATVVHTLAVRQTAGAGDALLTVYFRAPNAEWRP